MIGSGGKQPVVDDFIALATNSVDSPIPGAIYGVGGTKVGNRPCTQLIHPVSASHRDEFQDQGGNQLSVVRRLLFLSHQLEERSRYSHT